MVFDFSKLIGRIIEKFGTRYAFAEAAGYTRSQLSDRLNNKVYFDLVEIRKLCTPELLDIPDAEIPVYFFKLKFDKSNI